MSPIVVNTRALLAPLTGVQRYAREILARLGADVRPIAPTGPSRGIRGHLWEQLVLPRRAGRALLWSPANTGPLAASRHVVTIHDLVPIDHPEWLSPTFARWYRFLLPRLARRATRVITVSSFTKSRILECFGVPEERVEVIANGVDPRFRPCAPDVVRDVRRVLGVEQGRYLLCVGSLEPRKNLGRLLRAWDLVLPELPGDVHLVIAGWYGGARVFGEFSLGRMPARVKLVGRVSEVQLPALYAGALGFVYPSLYEGFGLPVLEAMACGVPTLSGTGSALPEVVGDAGLSVDPLDVESLADGVRRLVADDELRRCLGSRGLARAQGFTWDHAAAEVRRVLQEALP